MKQQLSTELEQVPLPKLILKYTSPAVLSSVVAALYNIIDQIFIGHYVGLEGNAATNVAFPLVTFTTALMLLIGLGGTINFSIAIGQKNLNQGKKYVGMVLLFTPLLGTLVTLFTLLFLEPLLQFLGATDASFDLACTYVSIVALGFPLWMTAESATKPIRSDGAPKYAMFCSLSGAILNCILNPLLMITFQMGIAGAAWATVIGQGVSFYLTLRYYKNFKTFPIVFSEIIPDMFTLKQTFSMGMSSFLNQIVMMIAQIVMNNVFVYYGALSIYGPDIPLACAGIITKVNSVYMAIMIGIAQGAQPLLGFCYGAGKHNLVVDIYLKCVQFATLISVFCFSLFQLFPREILQLFGGDGDLFFDFGIQYFRIFLALTFLNGILPITFNFFSSIGKPVKSAIISLSKQLLFLVPLLIIVPHFYGIHGILYTGPIADFLSFFLTIFLLQKEIKELSNGNSTNLSKGH